MIQSQKSILSNIESNPVYYIIKKIRLITLIESINPDSSPLVSPELVPISESNLKDVGRILTSDSLRRVAWYFLDYGAATSYILQFRGNVPEASAFRHIKTLRKMGVVVSAIRSRHPVDARGGPRPTIWMVPDAESDQIREAQKLHKRLLSPKYLYAERMAQLILDEYILVKDVTEISRKEYIELLMDRKVKRSMIPDLVMISIPYLKEKGITVWQ